MIGTRKRVGFDAKRLFHNRAGLGNYARTLVESLRQCYPHWEMYLYTTTAVRNHLTESFFIGYYNIRESSTFSTLYWRRRGIVGDLVKDKIDLFIGLSNEIPSGLKQANIASICIIHDVIFKRFRSHYYIWDRFIYDYKIRQALRDSDQIVSISHASSDELLHFYDLDIKKSQVVHPLVDQRFFNSSSEEDEQIILSKYPELTEDYFIYVGDMGTRKNLKIIIDAMSSLADIDSMINWVIISNDNKRARKLMIYAVERNVNYKTKVISGVPNEDIPAIYRLARFSVYPSIYEGFGLPVRESELVGTRSYIGPARSLKEAKLEAEVDIEHDVCSSVEDWENLLQKSLTNPETKVQAVQNAEEINHEILAKWKLILGNLLS